MNKKAVGWLIWVILVIIVIAIIGFIVMRGESTDKVTETDTTSIENIPDSEFAPIDTTNEVLDEIDDALGFV